MGTDDAYAASKKKKAKNITVSAVAVSENTIQLSWNKISKPYKGYAVFRDGVVVAHLGKKATSYTDTGLAAASAHSYQIKTYKVKKVKKKKKYTYKKKSNVASAVTYAPAPAPAAEPTPSQMETYNMTTAGGTAIYFNDSYDARLCKVSFSDSSVAYVKSYDFYDNNKLIRYLVVPYKNGETYMTITNEYTGQSKTVLLKINVPLCSVYSPYDLPYTIQYNNQTYTITVLQVGETYYSPTVYMDPNTEIVNVRIQGIVSEPYNVRLPIKFYDENGNLVGESTITSENDPAYMQGVFMRDATYAIKSGTTGRVQIRLGE